MNKQILTFLILSLTTLWVAKAQDYSGYTRCAEQDSLALVALYNATDGPNWLSNQDGFSISQLSDNVLDYHTNMYPNAGMGKWLQGPVKDWFGVLLEKQQIGSTSDSIWRVVHVRPTISRRSMGENKLKGYIPREMGYLTAINWLKVNGNSGLGGTELPDEIYHPTLRELDIEACGFEGMISNELRKCTKLSYFNIRTNKLDSVPIMDFMTPEHLLNSFNHAIIFFYTNRFAYSNLEASVEYFLSFSGTKQVQYEARQQNNIGQEREIIVKPGEKLVLSTNVGGKNGTYTWYRRGMNTYMPGSTFTINSVAAKDTGDYKVLVGNEYIRLNDLNADYVNVFSSNIYVRFEPVAPSIKQARSSYSGSEIELVVTKPMKASNKSQSSDFVVVSGGKTIVVSDVLTGGRFKEVITLKLASPILKGEEVKVTYTIGSVVCENGGVLASFSNHEIQNFTRATPNLLKTITREDGSGIFLTFDQYIDPTTFNVSDFTVSAGGNKTIHSIVLNPGAIDPHISRTIELVLNGSLMPTDVISVSYKRGALTALFGGTVQDFNNTPVENVVLDNRTPVLIRVTDGTRELQNVIVKGNMKSLPFNLFDDGTNGDEVANDHIWSALVELTDGQYSWNAFERYATASYDTIRRVDESGKIILEITPSYTYNDVLLSIGTNMQVLVADKTFSGTTHFGYRNNYLTFIVDMSNYIAQNPGAEVSPMLMGLDNDWTDGASLVPEYNGATTFIVTIGGFVPGQKVLFNFRNGDNWENPTPLTRSHLVIANDTIRSEFGLRVDRESLTNGQTFKVVPNPVFSHFTIQGSQIDQIISLEILNLQGQRIRELNFPVPSQIDVADLHKGVYILKSTTYSGNNYINQFIKK